MSLLTTSTVTIEKRNKRESKVSNAKGKKKEIEHECTATANQIKAQHSTAAWDKCKSKQKH
jgi:hypothetical protein